MRRHISALIVFVAALRSLESYGQQAATDEPPPTFIHSDYVIEEGANKASTAVMDIIAKSLRPRLPGWPKTLSPSAIWVDVSDQDKSLDDARILKLYVNVRNDELQPSEAEMRQLWEVARKQLEAELNRVTREVAEASRRRLDSVIHRLSAQRLPDSFVTELIEQLAELQAKSAGAEGNFSQGLTEAYSKQRELKLRDAGVRARREAIEHRIDELRKIADASTEADPILAELKKLVDIRRKQLEAVRALNAAGKSGGTDFQVSEAEGVLATALVEWTKAKQDAAERAGGGHLRALNDELSKLLVESAEIEGQRKELEHIIAEIRENVRDMALAMGEAENLKVKIQTVRSRLAEEDARINDLRREYERLEPQPVTLRPLTVDKSDPSEPGRLAPGAKK